MQSNGWRHTRRERVCQSAGSANAPTGKVTW
jgi:hypothetical protein